MEIKDLSINEDILNLFNYILNDSAKATVKNLLNFKNSLFFVSSHLHQLTEMEEIQNSSIATYYLDCNLKESTPAFTYELKQGWSDIKIGRILFEKEGLNEMLEHKHNLP